MMELAEKKIKIPSGISCKYFMPDRKDISDVNILIVSFYGVYPYGSRGNGHGGYIARATMQGISEFNAECLILDFRELEYKWGDTLAAVFRDVSLFKNTPKDEGGSDFPIFVVTSDKSRKGF